jgi:predicted ester cyclase
MYNQSFLTAFPGSKFEVLHTISQGDYVVVNWRASGAHTGPLQLPSGSTIQPTGKTATVLGSTTFQIENGKITRSLNFWDLASFLGQLGLLPPM